MKDITKRAAAGTTMAGALGLGVLGAGSGVAAAKPGHPGPHPNPPGPGVSAPASPGHGSGNAALNGSFGDDLSGRVNDDVDDDGGVNGDVNGHVGGSWNGGNISTGWLPGMPPGHNPFGPPGQLKQMADLTFNSSLNLGNGMTIPAGTVLPNPFRGMAPGQWASVNLATVLDATAPTAIRWLPPDSGLTAPLPLVWDSASSHWGVTVNGVFTPYPIQLPAPMGG